MTVTRVGFDLGRKHVIKEVLNQPEDGALALALDNAHFREIEDALAASDKTISELTFNDVQPDGTTVTRTLPPGVAVQVDLLRKLAVDRYQQGNPITDWTTVTRAEFLEFRAKHVAQGTIPAFAGASTATTRSPTTSFSPTNMASSVKDFDKTVKRDIDAYPVLRGDKGWDTWYQSFVRQAKAQRMNNILDENYKPSTAEDIELFERQNDFMMSVFDKKLQTDQAKEAMRQNKDEKFQAQAVLREIKKNGEESTAAALHARQIMQYLVSARWGNPSTNWKGGATGFIRHWKEQCGQYKELTGEDAFSSDTMTIMLQNAVGTLTELDAVATQDEHLSMISGKNKLDFQQYYTLLISAAQKYDNKNGVSMGRSRRQVYQHEFAEQPAGIDTPVENLMEHDPPDTLPFQVNQADQYRTPSRGLIPSATWQELSREHREIWTRLPRNVREAILSARNSPNSVSANLHELSAQEYLESELKVNLADTSAHELLQVMRHERDPEEEQWADAVESTDEADGDQTGTTAGSDASGWVANKADTFRRHSPSSVASILSRSLAKKDGGGTPTSSNTPTRDVTVNGKTHKLAVLGKSDSTTKQQANKVQFKANTAKVQFQANATKMSTTPATKTKYSTEPSDESTDVQFSQRCFFQDPWAGTRERSGRIVSIGEGPGPTRTYTILVDGTNEVIYRSMVRLASAPGDRGDAPAQPHAPT